MKAITQLSLLLWMLCFSWSARAHQPDLSSTILAEQGDGKWVLQIRAALTGFEYEVEAYHGKDAYASPQEFQEQVLDLLRGNVTLRFNDAHVAALGEGELKLGHETYVTFQIEGVPDQVQSLEVTNTSFSNIPRNQSALLVLKKGFAKQQFTLNEENEHTASLKVEEGKLVLLASAPANYAYWPFLIAGVLLISLSIGYSVYKNRQVSTVLN